ncbi:MAG: hypothetical protein ACK401_02160 [Archaeoglobaceae archaeon]
MKFTKWAIAKETKVARRIEANLAIGYGKNLRKGKVMSKEEN